MIFWLELRPTTVYNQIAMNDKKFLIMHIPKCAGTAFKTGLTTRFGSSSVMELYNGKDGRGDLIAPVDHYSEDFIIGHFGAAYFDGVEHNREIITFLREPIDRILSHYYYWRSQKCSSVAIASAQRLSLVDFLRSDIPEVRFQISNLQTWLCAFDMVYENRIKNACIPQNEILEMAKDNLSKFNFVGLTENFTSDMNYLNNRYLWGIKSSWWGRRSFWRVVNKTDLRKTVDEIDDEAMELLRSLTTMDRLLYDFVKELRRAHGDKYPTIQ